MFWRLHFSLPVPCHSWCLAHPLTHEVNDSGGVVLYDLSRVGASRRARLECMVFRGARPRLNPVHGWETTDSIIRQYNNCKIFRSFAENMLLPTDHNLWQENAILGCLLGPFWL